MANTTVNIDVQVQTKSLQDLENELEDINKQLKDVPIGSEAFKELSGQAQEVTKELERVNSEVEGFTLDKKIETSQAAVLGFAGSLEAVVGTLGLLGVESEVFGEFEEKAVSALTAARGLIDLSEGFGKLARSINLSTVAAETFGKVSRKALIATGIGAFVIALGTIIANYEKIISLLDNVNGRLEKQNKLANEAIIDSTSQLNVLRLQQQTAQSRGEDEEKILEEIRKQLLVSQEQNNILLDNLTLQLQQEQSAANQLTFFERIRISIAGMVSPMLAAQQATAIMEGDTERIRELQDLINAAKERQAQLDLDLASLSSEKVNSEQEYLNLVEDVENKLLEFSNQTQLELLQAEREGIEDRINALEIGDEEKRELLDKYAEYYKQKEEQITKTQEEEERKRTQIALQGQADRFNAGVDNSISILERIALNN